MGYVSGLIIKLKLIPGFKATVDEEVILCEFSLSALLCQSSVQFFGDNCPLSSFSISPLPLLFLMPALLLFPLLKTLQGH